MVSLSPSGDVSSFFFKFPSPRSVNLPSRMTSTTQTLQAHNLPPSVATLSDIDYSNFFDLDMYLQDSTSEVMGLGVEKLSPKLANEETQEPPTEDSQETKKISVQQTPTPLIQVWPNHCSQKLAPKN
jgi:hypothetical protein